MTRIDQRNSGHLRSGFTLIELLVVMFIIVTVAGLAVYLFPKIQSEKGSRGAQDIQGNLMSAKYRALRDKNPVGIRLIQDPSDPTKVRSFQFIEQPGNWNSGRITQTSAQNVTPMTFDVTNADLSGGLGADTTIWPVQFGDYLYVNGALKGMVTGVTTTPTQRLTVNGDASFPPVPGTNDWFVVRRPRPIPGEEVVNFPDGVAIDLTPISPTIPRSIIQMDSNNKYDILFSPSGAVTGQAGVDGQVVLWVRDTTRDPADPGEQILIVVYTRTGMIGQYPVDTTVGQNPHSFRLDAKFRPSGL